MNECATMKNTQYLILRTVDGGGTLGWVEVACADARKMLALLAAGRRQPRVSPRTDTDPARISRAYLEIDMEDVPLTLADLLGAIAIGLALGALIAFGL